MSIGGVGMLRHAARGASQPRIRGCLVPRPGFGCDWLLGRGLLLTTAVCGLALSLPGDGVNGQEPDGGRPSPVEIHVVPVGDAPPVIEVSGVPAGVRDWLEAAEWDNDRWQRLLSVYVATGGKVARPVLGHYGIHGDRVRFQARFPLSPSLKYRVVWQPEELPGTVARSLASTEQIVSLPAVDLGPLVQVTQVFPSADVLPENQLKFYVHFSGPMSQGDSYRYIHLLQEDGREVAWPFLELGEELWEETGTRLTVFIDPGRIKQGLIPRQEMGPVLESGQRYVLAIDGDWPDAHGRPLKSGFRKSFQAKQADETQPDPHLWRLTLPDVGSRQPLSIEFREPLDEAMLHRVLNIYDSQGAVVPGEVRVVDHERGWRFTPIIPWPVGSFELRVHHTLEDLAGNSIGRPFEVDLQEKIERQVATPRTVVPFTIGR